jgi:type II secretory pathway component PulF
MQVLLVSCWDSADNTFLSFMKSPDKATVFRELAKLLKADFHLDRSLDLLLNQKPKAPVAHWLREVKAQLGSGVGLTEAIRQTRSGSITALDLAMIGAGEQSGRLGQSFTLLARYYETLAGSVSQARSALLYPLLLVHLAIILPEIPAAIAGGEAAAAPGHILWRLALFWLVLVGLNWSWKKLSALAEQSPKVDRMLEALPLLGAMRGHWALARFTQVAHSALLAAVRPQEWLRLAGEASGSGQFRVGSVRAAAEVARGEAIAVSLRSGGGFPKLFVDSLDTAEESGTLDHELARWANLETEQAQAAMSRVAAWLPKILYALIVLYVAWRIIGMMTGIYGPLLREAGVW